MRYSSDELAVLNDGRAAHSLHYTARSFKKRFIGYLNGKVIDSLVFLLAVLRLSSYTVNWWVSGGPQGQGKDEIT